MCPTTLDHSQLNQVKRTVAFLQGKELGHVSPCGRKCCDGVKARKEPGAEKKGSAEQGSWSHHGNKEAEAPITVPRCRLLPYFPVLCVEQSSAIAFLSGLVWICLLQQAAEKATACLSDILNWPCCRAAQLSHSCLLSEAGPSLPQTLLGQNQEVCPEGA